MFRQRQHPDEMPLNFPLKKNSALEILVRSCKRRVTWLAAPPGGHGRRPALRAFSPGVSVPRQTVTTSLLTRGQAGSPGQRRRAGLSHAVPVPTVKCAWGQAPCCRVWALESVPRSATAEPRDHGPRFKMGPLGPVSWVCGGGRGDARWPLAGRRCGCPPAADSTCSGLNREHHAFQSRQPGPGRPSVGAAPMTLAAEPLRALAFLPRPEL